MSLWHLRLYKYYYKKSNVSAIQILDVFSKISEDILKGS